MSAIAARPARTWIVSTLNRPDRTEEVDHLARSAEGGLSYLTGEDLPPYLGVWGDPQGENTWHLYSDYPPSQHKRFGWKVVAAGRTCCGLKAWDADDLAAGEHVCTCRPAEWQDGPTRDETRRQASVADALRASARLRAAVELEQAREVLRLAASVGRATAADRFRVGCAEAVWDAERVTVGLVRS